MGGAHALMFKKHTEGHALTYLKSLLMAKIVVRETLGVTNWMVCLCKHCLSDINYALLL